MKVDETFEGQSIEEIAEGELTLSLTDIHYWRAPRAASSRAD